MKLLNKIYTTAVTMALYAFVTVKPIFADGGPYSPYSPHKPVDTSFSGNDVVFAILILTAITGSVLISTSKHLKTLIEK